jgi:hypothetical protein
MSTQNHRPHSIAMVGPVGLYCWYFEAYDTVPACLCMASSESSTSMVALEYSSLDIGF